MKNIKVIAVMAGLLSMAAFVSANVQAVFNYQGRLTQQDGTPYTGNHSITLSIYDVPTGGVALRSAVYQRNIMNGYFNIQFGTEVTMDISTLPFDQQYYIGVRVDAQDEMTPREKLGSVAYAMRAMSSGSIDDNAVTTAKLSDSAVTGPKLATSAASLDKLASNAVNSSKIVDGSVAQADLAMNAVMPVGSIIAWHKSLYNTLPSNWVECNGGTVSDSSSPINGSPIPNLNGEGRFLRGGTTSGTMQADELKNHTHKVISSWVSGNRTEWHVVADWTDANDGPTDEKNGPSLTSTGGGETRPINMSVIWIMKIK